MKEENRKNTKEIKHQRTITRGSVLLALLVSSFALVVVLALTTLSSLNINIVRSQVEYTQATFTAQAAVAQLLYELDTYNFDRNSDVSSPSVAMDIKTRCRLSPIIESEIDYFQGEASVTFEESKSFFSTDNFVSEYSAHGWRDKGKNSMSVPPFSIDLIVNVKIGGSERHYNAIIRRIWPYAVLCERGPIIISSQKSNESMTDSKPAPSQIKGNIISYSSVSLGTPSFPDIENCVIGNICTTLSKPQQNSCSFDPIIINNGSILKGKKQYNVSLRENAPIESLKFPDKKTFKELLPEDLPGLEMIGFNADTSLTLFNSILPGDQNEGSFMWAYSNEKFKKFILLVDKYISIAFSKPESLPEEMQLYIDNYIKSKLSVNPNSDMFETTCNAIRAYIQNKYFGLSYFMKKSLILQGNDECNRYLINGNLSNHLFRCKYGSNDSSNIEKPNDTIWEEGGHTYSKAGLILKDCTLFVNGDIELQEFSPDGTSAPSTIDWGEKLLSINGENATLIVSGNMKIIGGNLDSKNKGMVMLAKNMEFSSKGNFKGLILSKGAILINPYPGSSSTSDRLHIDGALACGGAVINQDTEEGFSSALPGVPEGLTLKSVELTLDHRYTKALHQSGDARVIFWQELK